MTQPQPLKPLASGRSQRGAEDGGATPPTSARLPPLDSIQASSSLSALPELPTTSSSPTLRHNIYLSKSMPIEGGRASPASRSTSPSTINGMPTPPSKNLNVQPLARRPLSSGRSEPAPRVLASPAPFLNGSGKEESLNASGGVKTKLNTSGNSSASLPQQQKSPGGPSSYWDQEQKQGDDAGPEDTQGLISLENILNSSSSMRNSSSIAGGSRPLTSGGSSVFGTRLKGDFAAGTGNSGSHVSQSVAAPFISKLMRECVAKDDLAEEISFVNWDDECALLFIDISGYSKLASQVEGAHALADAVNQFFTPVLDIIDEFQGDVLKFAGDALIAVWTISPIRSLSLAVQTGLACAEEIHSTLRNSKEEQELVQEKKKAAQSSSPKANRDLDEGTPLTPTSRKNKTSPALEVTNTEKAHQALELHIGMTAGRLEAEVFVPRHRGSHSSLVMQRGYFFVGGPVLQGIDHVVDSAPPGRTAISTDLPRHLRDPTVLTTEAAGSNGILFVKCVAPLPPLAAVGKTSSRQISAVPSPSSRSAGMSTNAEESAEGSMTDAKLILFQPPPGIGGGARRTSTSPQQAQQLSPPGNRTSGKDAFEESDTAEDSSEFSDLIDQANEDDSSSIFGVDMQARLAAMDDYFIPPTILTKLRMGMRTEDMAEMRNLYILFIQKIGDVDNIDWFDEVFYILNEGRAPITQIIEDDKGVHVIAALNLYQAEEGAADAAVRLAQQLIVRKANCRVGVAAGSCFCGIVGSDKICRWDITGSACVRSCRLMQFAASNDILTAIDFSVANSVKDGTLLRMFNPEVKVKGTEDPIPVFTLAEDMGSALSSICAINEGAPEVHANVRKQITKALFGKDATDSKNKSKKKKKSLVGESSDGQNPLDDQAGGGAEGEEPPFWRYSPEKASAVMVVGQLNSGKKHLLLTSIHNTPFSAIIHRTQRDPPNLDICRTVATWFMHHPDEGIVAKAEEAHEAIKLGHSSWVLQASLDLIKEVLSKGNHVAILVDRVQYLDDPSLRFISKVKHLQSELDLQSFHRTKNKVGGATTIGRWIWLLSFTPQFDCVSQTKVVKSTGLDAKRDVFKLSAVSTEELSHLMASFAFWFPALEGNARIGEWCDGLPGTYRDLQPYLAERFVPPIFVAREDGKLFDPARRDEASKEMFLDMVDNGEMIDSDKKDTFVDGLTYRSAMPSLIDRMVQYNDVLKPRQQVLLKVLSALTFRIPGSAATVGWPTSLVCSIGCSFFQGGGITPERLLYDLMTMKEVMIVDVKDDHVRFNLRAMCESVFETLTPSQRRETCRKALKVILQAENFKLESQSWETLTSLAHLSHRWGKASREWQTMILLEMWKLAEKDTLLRIEQMKTRRSSGDATTNTTTNTTTTTTTSSLGEGSKVSASEGERAFELPANLNDVKQHLFALLLEKLQVDVDCFAEQYSHLNLSKPRKFELRPIQYSKIGDGKRLPIALEMEELKNMEPPLALGPITGMLGNIVLQYVERMILANGGRKRSYFPRNSAEEYLRLIELFETEVPRHSDTEAQHTMSLEEERKLIYKVFETDEVSDSTKHASLCEEFKNYISSVIFPRTRRFTRFMGSLKSFEPELESDKKKCQTLLRAFEFVKDCTPANAGTEESATKCKKAIMTLAVDGWCSPYPYMIPTKLRDAWLFHWIDVVEIKGIIFLFLLQQCEGPCDISRVTKVLLSKFSSKK